MAAALTLLPTLTYPILELLFLLSYGAGGGELTWRMWCIEFATSAAKQTCLPLTSLLFVVAIAATRGIPSIRSITVGHGVQTARQGTTAIPLLVVGSSGLQFVNFHVCADTVNWNNCLMQMTLGV